MAGEENANFVADEIQSSNATASSQLNSSAANDIQPGVGKRNVSRGKRLQSSRASSRKKTKSSSTVTGFLKDIFFLVDNTCQVPKFKRRSKLAEEGFVKNAVRFTSDMDETEIFSTIREKFLEKFDGNVPPFKILKAYGTKLVSPNLDGEWTYKVLKHQCGNGPIYVCPDTVRVSSDSEEELYNPFETEVKPQGLAHQHSNPHSSSTASSTQIRCDAKPPEIHVIPSEVLSRAEITCPVCHLKVPSMDIEVHADRCAETAAAEYANLVSNIDCQPVSNLNDDDELMNEHQRSLEFEEVYTSILEGDVKHFRSVIKEDVSKLSRVIDDTDGLCHLSIRRLHAWKDYVSFFKKPWNKHKASYPITVTFLGEAAVDTGGPKREFFCEALSQAKDELFVLESSGSFVPNTSAMLVSQGLFTLAGQLMATSIYQGGPAPSFFAPWVYNHLLHGSDAMSSFNEMSLAGKDSKYEELFKKILAADTDERLQQILTSDEGFDMLDEIGFRGVPQQTKLAGKDDILKSIYFNAVILNAVPALQQLANGLALNGLLNLMRENSSLYEVIFTTKGSKMFTWSYKDFMENVQAEYSEQGSTKHQSEVNCHKAFIDAMEEIFNCESEKLKPGHMLKFVTGTDVIPPLGLPAKLKLHFVHGCQVGCRCRPTSSTCALQLRLPSSFPSVVLHDSARFSCVRWIQTLLYLSIKTIHVYQSHDTFTSLEIKQNLLNTNERIQRFLTSKK